ncbi:MAG: hypothetical protein PVG79_12255 [Gemmatimonadales bacterium]|jgi:hypothetical protein
MEHDAVDFKTLIEDALASDEPDGAITTPSGTRMTYQKRPEPGVAIRLTGEQSGPRRITLIMYEAAPARPDAYPPSLPYIPDATAAVMVLGEDEAAHTVVWPEVPEVSPLVDELVRQSLEGGWEIEAASPVFFMRMVGLRRGSRHRHIMAISLGRTRRFVSLTEGEPKR